MAFALAAAASAAPTSAELRGLDFVLAIHGHDAYAITGRATPQFVRRDIRTGVTTRLAAFDSLNAFSEILASKYGAVAWVDGPARTKSLVAVDRTGNARVLESDVDDPSSGLDCDVWRSLVEFTDSGAARIFEFGQKPGRRSGQCIRLPGQSSLYERTNDGVRHKLWFPSRYLTGQTWDPVVRGDYAAVSVRSKKRSGGTDRVVVLNIRKRRVVRVIHLPGKLTGPTVQMNDAGRLLISDTVEVAHDPLKQGFRNRLWMFDSLKAPAHLISRRAEIEQNRLCGSHVMQIAGDDGETLRLLSKRGKLEFTASAGAWRDFEVLACDHRFASVWNGIPDGSDGPPTDLPPKTYVPQLLLIDLHRGRRI